ncbi:glycan biosynthesis hexose transferase WsfD [Arthrobacter sp. 2MCAF14]|uniref:glycan biosynthesis hexose transferase WsfD n=1 Tax=Arthrobacter sp. 2MCAF14 TaxID=3232982 RepID=UPI003F8E13D1
MVDARPDAEKSEPSTRFDPEPLRRKSGAAGPLRSAAGYLARTFGPGEVGLREVGLREVGLREVGQGAPGSLRLRAVAGLSGTLASLVMILRLFLPRTVGMADDGTGQQLLCSLGVRNLRPWGYADFTDFIQPSWVPHQYYGEACGFTGSGEPVYSSQLLLLWLGKWLTPVFAWGPGLDTRAVGIVCCVAFGALTAGLVAALPGRMPFRVLIAALVTLVTVDGVFADFFVSPYSEPAAFLGTLALAVALLRYWNGGRLRWASVLMVVLAAAFTVSAMPQMVSWVPAVALALLWLPAARARRRATPARRRWQAFVMPSAAVVAIAGVAVAFLSVEPKRATEVNLYNTVFASILPNSPDPVADLKWLGLDRSFVTAAGSTMDSVNSAVYNPHYPQFGEQINRGKIAEFFATHPERLIGLGERGISALLTPEPSGGGSYMEDSGQAPGVKERRLPVVLGLYTAMNAAPVALLGLHLLTLLMGFAVAARRKSGIGRLAVVIVLGCWAQFWVVLILEGQPEIHRQMILAGFMSALCVPLLVALVSILASKSTQPRSQPHLV